MTNNKHIPKRRFKEFESDGEWEQEKLGEISNITAGGDVVKEKLLTRGNYPVLANAHTNEGVIGYYEEDYQVEAPAVTVTGRGDIGFAKARKENFTPVVRLLSVKSEHNVDFLAEAINQNNVVFESTGVPQLTIPKLSNYKVYFPSTIGEENSIGNFLVSFDSLIALHQHKLDKLKNIKKSYLAELFPAEGERLPKRRFPGFEGAWEGKKLGEITTYRNGTGHEEKQSRFGKYELVNLNSISIDGGLKPSGRFIEEASETLMKNDLVMVLSDVAHGDLLGRVAVIPENDKFVLNQRVALLRHNGIVDIKYLFSFINAHQKYFKLQGAGSSQLNLSRDSVENFEVALPSVEEQKTIGNFFEKLDKYISLQQQKLDKLKDLKKAYLNELFV
jgi:type I R/M system specificity subunit